MNQPLIERDLESALDVVDQIEARHGARVAAWAHFALIQGMDSVLLSRPEAMPESFVLGLWAEADGFFGGQR